MGIRALKICPNWLVLASAFSPAGFVERSVGHIFWVPRFWWPFVVMVEIIRMSTYSFFKEHSTHFQSKSIYIYVVHMVWL